MKKLSNHLPVGIEFAPFFQIYLFFLVLAVGMSTQFFYEFEFILIEQQEILKHEKVLLQTEYFGRLTTHALTLFPLVYVWCLCMIGFCYGHHFIGSHSIYVMRRLPDRWELLRRVVTVPLGLLGVSLVITIAV